MDEKPERLGGSYKEAIASIAEGIELAGVDVDFVYFEEGIAYSNATMKDASRTLDGIYCRKVNQSDYGNLDGIPKPFRPRMQARLPSSFARALGAEEDRILILGYREYLSMLQGVLDRYTTKEFKEFVRGASQEEFNRLLTAYAFHEALHHKYDGELLEETLDAYNLPRHLSGFEAYRPNPYSLDTSLPLTTLQHIPIFVEELELSERRHDLKPCLDWEMISSMDPYYEDALKLAKRIHHGARASSSYLR